MKRIGLEVGVALALVVGWAGVVTATILGVDSLLGGAVAIVAGLLLIWVSVVLFIYLAER